MKCKHCGGDLFFAHQLVRMDVVCSEDGDYEDAVNRIDPMSDIYDSEACYGPFQCLGCGATYDELKEGEVCTEGPQEGWAPVVPFKKVRDFVRDDGKRFQKWEGERYIVTLEFVGDTVIYFHASIKPNGPNYLPRIILDTMGGDVLEARIETTSYASMETGEYQKLLEAMKAAYIDARNINACFVYPLREKRFEMGDPI